MKCPLQVILTNQYTSSSPNPTHTNIDFFQCDEGCAWYDQVQKVCSIKVIRVALVDIAKALTDLSERH